MKSLKSFKKSWAERQMDWSFAPTLSGKAVYFMLVAGIYVLGTLDNMLEWVKSFK